MIVSGIVPTADGHDLSWVVYIVCSFIVAAAVMYLWRMELADRAERRQRALDNTSTRHAASYRNEARATERQK